MISRPDPGLSRAVQQSTETARLWRVGRPAAGEVVAAAMAVVLAGRSRVAAAEPAGTSATRAELEVPVVLAGACAKMGVASDSDHRADP